MKAKVSARTTHDRLTVSALFTNKEKITFTISRSGERVTFHRFPSSPNIGRDAVEWFKATLKGAKNYAEAMETVKQTLEKAVSFATLAPLIVATSAPAPAIAPRPSPAKRLPLNLKRNA